MASLAIREALPANGADHGKVLARNRLENTLLTQQGLLLCSALCLIA